MDLETFLAHVDRGGRLVGGSEHHRFMHAAAQEALGTVAELNSGYRSEDEVRALLSRLTGTTVDASVVVFPPFYSEFGKNLRFGRDVFVNMGCRFQDTGGITIEDGALIGHGCTLTTLDHDMDPERRADMLPRAVVVGRGAWLGAGVTVVPGVRIGHGAVVGAGAVVTRDVPPDTVVAGVPARVIRPTGFTTPP
ncbi:DapH/DapD/GlmU-related protein [Aquipuribacter nitratireducens]|uniref:DapH/DapD/GlmU-related protein n=1 Tax=Aquipuribacter nitratireducens TaxID=650104 RepID=A0ABW0GL56_9MICO